MGRHQPCLRMNYQGWPTHEARPPKAIDEIDADIDPQDFWARYISQRKPALLDGHPTDPEWTATDRWTPEYLGAVAGGVPVRVERRGAAGESFGRGDATKVDMPFGRALARVAAGDASLYMTTQPVAPGPDGHPELMAPPTSHLAGDLPLRPALAGALVPQQVNIWMGCAPEGSSTGLHLDFHDNLYVLLYGRKRFRVWPPSAVGDMYVHGEPTVVHPNGRVVFAAQGDVRADGAAAGDAAAADRRAAAEAELVAAEAAVAAGQRGAKKRLAAAERALDAVLEAALEADALDDFDDYEALEAAGAGAPQPGSATAGEPDSFSRVDLSLPAAQLRRRFPRFQGAAAALEVTVAAGQSLYLPAGWFHEVTSFSGGGEGDENGAPTFHLALNYWFHPPDALDPGPAGFARPYDSDYWPRVWAGRERRYAELQERAAAAAAAAARGGAKRKRGEEEESSEEEEEEEEEGHECGPHCDHGHGGQAWRAPTSGERAHFLGGIRGMFGHGRRQHLHRFVGLRIRGDVH